MKILQIKKQDKSLGKIASKPAPKNILERIAETIPKSRYKELLQILEPHEIPKRNRNK